MPAFFQYVNSPRKREERNGGQDGRVVVLFSDHVFSGTKVLDMVDVLHPEGK